MTDVWFAWYPVRTEQRKWAWMRKIVRVWDSHWDLQVIDPYDLGEYVGGWRYHG